MNSKSPRSVDEALEMARARLGNTNSGPFSPAAFRALQDIVETFINDLIYEALRVSRQHKAEVVSPTYVESASTYLVASRVRRLFRHMGTVGGILLGGSLSNILAMAQTSTSLPKGGTLVSVGVGLLGTFLVAMHMVKD